MGDPATGPWIPAPVREAVVDLRARLIARFGDRLQDIRLFGSYARGDWGSESDIDVLVVIDRQEERERREVFDLAWDVWADRLVHVSPLALSSKEWETLRSREYRIAVDIEREGVAP